MAKSEAEKKLEEQLKAAQAENKTLKDESDSLKGEVETLKKDSEPVKAKPLKQYRGLITTLSISGKKIPEGTPETELDEKVVEEFEKYIGICSK